MFISSQKKTRKKLFRDEFNPYFPQQPALLMTSLKETASPKETARSCFNVQTSTLTVRNINRMNTCCVYLFSLYLLFDSYCWSSGGSFRIGSPLNFRMVTEKWHTSQQRRGGCGCIICGFIVQRKRFSGS